MLNQSLNYTREPALHEAHNSGRVAMLTTINVLVASVIRAVDVARVVIVIEVPMTTVEVVRGDLRVEEIVIVVERAARVRVDAAVTPRQEQA